MTADDERGPRPQRGPRPITVDDVAAARAARDAAEQHLRDTIRRALTQPRAHRPRAGDIAAAAGLSRGRCYQIRDEP